MRRITGHAGFVIGLAAEELPGNRIHPARTKGLIALIEGMLQIKQREHQTGGEPRATATPDASNLETWTKEIILWNRS